MRPRSTPAGVKALFVPDTHELDSAPFRPGDCWNTDQADCGLCAVSRQTVPARKVHCVSLLERLGYPRFAAHGAAWGAPVTADLGHRQGSLSGKTNVWLNQSVDLFRRPEQCRFAKRQRQPQAEGEEDVNVVYRVRARYPDAWHDSLLHSLIARP